jgi:aspartate racemase
MKTLGLIGSLDYKRTLEYLEALNNRIVQVKGEKYSLKSWIYNFDKSELSIKKDKQHYLKEVIYHSDALRQSGADLLVLCEESMHEIVKDIRRNIGIPVIHIGEVLGREVIASHIKKVLIVGSRESMQSEVYIHALNRAGIKVAIPDIKLINDIEDLLEEENPDKIKLISIIESFRMKGVAGVVFCHPKLNQLIDPSELSMTVFDSFKVHIDHIIKEIGIG